MRTTRWLPAGAALLLVLGVLAARGGSAAAEEDLRPVAAQPSAEPSVSEPPSLVPVVLETDGLPGARLGAPGESFQTAVPVRGPDAVAWEDLPGGCVPAWSLPADGSDQQWETAVWLVEDEVASVVLTRWDLTTAVVPGLQTWLGPTLGSPVAEASALPGARTRLERPFGADGPTVTVVHVPGDEVEVVYSDATYRSGSQDGAVGRITTVEVRDPRARACSFEAFLQAAPMPWGAPEQPAELEIGPDGLTTAPIGTPVAAVRALPGVTDETTGQDGCEAFSLTSAAGGWVRLVALGGVVVQAQASGSVVSSLPVQMGDPMAEVRAAHPELADRQPADGWGSHEVVVGPRVVGYELSPGDRWVPDVDVSVSGGPAEVRSVSVRDAGVAAPGLC